MLHVDLDVCFAGRSPAAAMEEFDRTRMVGKDPMGDLEVPMRGRRYRDVKGSSCMYIPA